MPFNINEFKSQLTFDGARPSHFQVQIQNPVNAAGDLKIPFMVKAASIPGVNLGAVNAPYFGREIKLAGDQTFDDWTVTVINDEDFLIRNAMEAWTNSINSREDNLRQFESASPESYKADAQITQFSKTGVPIREYTIQGMFPTVITPIETSWESQNEIEQFDVTFAYDYWDISGGSTGFGT